MSVIYIILIVILDYIFVIFHLEKAQKYFMQLYFNSLFSVLILNLFFFFLLFLATGVPFACLQVMDMAKT